MEYRYGYTLGKRLLRLRVEMDDGRPCILKTIVVRNILRIIDIMPIFYIVGLLFILVTMDRKRIGDIIAQTVVVREV